MLHSELPLQLYVWSKVGVGAADVVVVVDVSGGGGTVLLVDIVVGGGVDDDDAEVVEDVGEDVGADDVLVAISNPKEATVRPSVAFASA